MPIIKTSTYRPPFLFANGHLQTLYATLGRKLKSPISYVRERIETPDNDFIDIDWLKNGSKSIVVLVHGMEGHSYRKYMLGMAGAFKRRAWDCVAVNLRGCSGEPNRHVRSYHSGKTEDLDLIVNHILKQKQYDTIALVGFSVGGNIVCKYVGEKRNTLPQQIKRSAGISVPCDLEACAWHMARRSNSLYMTRFLKYFHTKIKTKMKLMPGKVSDKGFKKIRTFKEYDDRYTAPHNGFSNAEDYWHRASCQQFLHAIEIPTLILNAENDPMLPEECFPVAEASTNNNLFLEIPESGGHAGFVTFNSDGEYWHEKRVTDFICNPNGVLQ